MLCDRPGRRGNAPPWPDDTPSSTTPGFHRSAGNACSVRQRRDWLRSYRAPGNLQHKFIADRIAELLALFDRDHERSGSPDNAIPLVSVEALNVHEVWPVQHDRQAIDSDILRQDLITNQRHERTIVVGAIAGHVNNAADPAIRARFK